MNLYPYPVGLQGNQNYPVISTDNKTTYDPESLYGSMNAIAQNIIRVFQEIANALRPTVEAILSACTTVWKQYQRLTKPHHSKQTRAFLRVKQGRPVFTPHAHKKGIGSRRAVYQSKNVTLARD